MDKEQMQDQELDQVSGGFNNKEKGIRRNCPSCGGLYYEGYNYPKGLYYGRTENGCWHAATIHYKCPNCGHEWNK